MLRLIKLKGYLHNLLTYITPNFPHFLIILKVKCIRKSIGSFEKVSQKFIYKNSEFLIVHLCEIHEIDIFLFT